MTHLFLRVLSVLACAVSLNGLRYGDYSVAPMPQYGGQHEYSEGPPGADEYGDRSPDAPARLDYKYEEEPHGKSDDVSVLDIDDERVWEKRKRKPAYSQSNRNFRMDKKKIDEVVPEFKTNNELVKYKSRFQNRNFDRHLKHNSIDQSDDTDNVGNNDHTHKEHVDTADIDDFEDIRHFKLISSTQRKARRKPRDRALHQSERKEDHKRLKIEDDDTGTMSGGNEHFESKKAMRPGYIIDRADVSVSNKKNYDYDEYYDMKRVRNMKSRLPTLFRQTTDTPVRKTEAQSTRSLVHRQFRRGGSPAEHFGNVSDVSGNGMSSTHMHTDTPTTSPSSVITKTIVENSSDLSVAEKSRLSILKKVQKKESSKHFSSTTKPPVLMQVTHGMQTVVVVEPQPAEVALRARLLAEDSPARLQRARRLMRRKLVAGARSVQDLTNGWDELVCDYIDVALLDADAASFVGLDSFLAKFIFISCPLLVMFK